MNKIILCKHCGKERNISDFRQKYNHDYCSQSCRALALGESVIKKCKVCGNDFLAKKSNILRGKSNYCSRPCFDIGRTKEKKVFVCEICGVEFLPNQYEKNRKFCSRGCYGKSGVGTEIQKIRGSGIYKEWRELVFKKDNYICQKCGSLEKIRPHHIESFSSNPELRTETSNGITLCNDCHKNFHHIFGIKNNTQNQLTIYLSNY